MPIVIILQRQELVNGKSCRTVLAPDLRGLGDTTKPATGYDKATVAGDIRALVAKLGLGTRVNIVGHDLGGMVAYAHFPEDSRTRTSETPLHHFHFVRRPCIHGNLTGNITNLSQDRIYLKKPLGRCTRTIAAAAGNR